MTEVWGAEAFADEEGAYFAGANPDDGLHLFVFRASWPDYDEYELILIREPQIESGTAGRAWGRVAGSVTDVLRRLADESVAVGESSQRAASARPPS